MERTVDFSMNEETKTFGAYLLQFFGTIGAAISVPIIYLIGNHKKLRDAFKDDLNAHEARVMCQFEEVKEQVGQLDTKVTVIENIRLADKEFVNARFSDHQRQIDTLNNRRR